MAMIKRMAFILLVLMPVLGSMACSSMLTSPGSQSQSPVSATQSPTPLPATPLSWLLRVVPSGKVKHLMYNDVPALSAYQNQAIPSRQASMEKKRDWWSTFQRDILASYSFPGVIDISIDIQGMLMVSPQMTILGGHLDTAALQEKLKSYQYTEESYLGYPVLSGVPQSTIPVNPPLAEWMPRAFGIIDGIKTNGDIVSIILMSTNNDVIQAKNAVQYILKSYQDKTTLAYKSGGITALANSLGLVGSAFITVDPGLENMLQGIAPEERERYIGPGKLSSYSQLAISFRKSGNDSIVEFIPDVRGRLEDKDSEYILWWGSYGSPKSLGSTLRLHASRQFSKEELIKIAASTPSPTPASAPSGQAPNDIVPAPDTVSPGQLPEFGQQSNDLPLRIISLTSPVNPGLSATLVVETLPGAECSAIVDYGPSGNSVLRSQVADGNGKVSWTWTVGRFSGNWQITVKASYGGKRTSTMTPFTVR
jgi:hypothetical protein